MCTTITVVYSAMLLLFPGYVFLKIKFSFKKIRMGEIDPITSVFVEGTRTKTLNQALYNFYFMIRRLISVGVLIYMSDYSYF